MQNIIAGEVLLEQVGFLLAFRYGTIVFSMDMPREIMLSVCVPNYNHARYLPECLDAIFGQSRIPDEVIVIDDGSTDSSLEVIASYERKYPQLRCIRHEKNRGVHFTVCESIREAKGTYIGLYSADDFLFPITLEKSFEIFMRHPEVVMTFGDFALFDDQKPYRFREVHLLKTDQPKILDPDEFVRLARKSTFHVTSSTCVFRRDLLLQLDAYNTPDLKSWTDFYLNCEIALQHPIAYIPHLLGAYRCVAASYGQTTGGGFAKRKDISLSFLNRVDQKSPLFQQRLRKSALLNFGGFSLAIVLCMRPRYWRYLPLILWKKLPDLPATVIRCLKKVLRW